MAEVSTIAAVAPVLPDHAYSQADITAELVPLLTRDGSGRALLERLHAGTGIETRHLALPLGAYRRLGSFTEANDAFIRIGTDLAERAVRDALAACGLAANDVDFLLFTSVTGVSAPSIDALLVSRLGLREDVKRLPSFGLGCVAGAAGLARLHDYLLGHPDDVAVLVSVELCSLTLQREDSSVAGLVAAGLFGDGAAAVVMLGERRARRWAQAASGQAASGPATGRVAPGRASAPVVIDTRSRIYPGTAADLGWAVGASGFRIVLSARLAEVIEAHLDDDVAAFLYPHGLKAGDVGTWVAHAGGPRILDAVTGALDLDPGALGVSRRSLARVGNLSSASVLHVLADTIAARSAPGRGNAASGGVATGSGMDAAGRGEDAAGSRRSAAEQIAASGSDGLLLAFGPGVSAELVLLRWPDGPRPEAR